MDQGDRTDYDTCSSKTQDGINGVGDERRSSGDNGTDDTDHSSGGIHSGDPEDKGNNDHSLDISSLIVPMFTSTPKEEKTQLCCGGAGDGGGGSSDDDDDDHWSQKIVTWRSHNMVNHKNNSEDDELFDETLDKIIGELTFIGEEDTEGPKQAECVSQKEEETQERNASKRAMTGGGLSVNYQIIKMQSKKIKKYNTERETWEVIVKMQDDQLEQHGFHRLMVQIFNELVDRIAHGFDDHDRIRVVIRHLDVIDRSTCQW